MPTIHQDKEVKHALLLQLVGADNVYDKSGFLEERGCIHIALIGNPGTGKTYMSRRIGKFWPIYRFTSAVTATGRGLIAVATFDFLFPQPPVPCFLQTSNTTNIKCSPNTYIYYY